MMKWILGIVATEGIVEVLIHSELLDKPRQYLMGRYWLFQKLLSCGWCLSLWVAVAVFGIVSVGWQIILVPIVIHRASNFLHMGWGILKMIRWRK